MFEKVVAYFFYSPLPTGPWLADLWTAYEPGLGLKT